MSSLTDAVSALHMAGIIMTIQIFTKFDIILTLNLRIQILPEPFRRIYPWCLGFCLMCMTWVR
jgi:hypothetical protein